MMVKYCSWLEWMRIRASEEEKDLAHFWHTWNTTISKSFNKNRKKTEDYKQYVAEKGLFRLYWSEEIFPGQDPYRKYHSLLRMMQMRAIKEGMTYTRFDQIVEYFEEEREDDSDYSQYVLEKKVWDWNWSDKGEPFHGIDPSVIISPVSDDSDKFNITSAPSNSSGIAVATGPSNIVRTYSEELDSTFQGLMDSVFPDSAGIVSGLPTQQPALQNPQYHPAGKPVGTVSILADISEYRFQDQTGDMFPGSLDPRLVNYASFRGAAPLQREISKPAKRPFDSSFFDYPGGLDDLVDAYTGKGINYNVGGEATPRKLDFTPYKKRAVGENQGVGSRVTPDETELPALLRR